MNNCDICGSHNRILKWKINYYNIFRCCKCGLVYADVKENDLVNIYETDYYKKVYPEYDSDKSIHLRNSNLIIDNIEKYYEQGELIEIGSAFGFFLESSICRGWNSIGFEISEFASKKANELYGNAVINRDFISENIKAQFDVVCMLNTIEHIFRLSIYIKKISKILKPGAGIVITTGDIDSKFARFFGKNWRMIKPPYHIYYYSPKTITKLLERYGLSVISITHPRKYQNFNSMIKYLFGFKKIKFLKIPIKVNVGDIMCVIAKKDQHFNDKKEL